MKNIKLFLDDIRQPEVCTHYMYSRIGNRANVYNEDWVIVRNYHEFWSAVVDYHGKIDLVSFDHDLADAHYDPNTWTEGFKYEEETGMDCARFLKNYYSQNKLKLPEILVHSMNPDGSTNIQNVFK